MTLMGVHDTASTNVLIPAVGKTTMISNLNNIMNAKTAILGPGKIKAKYKKSTETKAHSWACAPIGRGGTKRPLPLLRIFVSKLLLI
jgi:hypothetical protein